MKAHKTLLIIFHFVDYSLQAWEYMYLKDIVVKVANVKLYYEVMHFYLQKHLDLVNCSLRRSYTCHGHNEKSLDLCSNVNDS